MDKGLLPRMCAVAFQVLKTKTQAHRCHHTQCSPLWVVLDHCSFGCQPECRSIVIESQGLDGLVETRGDPVLQCAVVYTIHKQLEGKQIAITSTSYTAVSRLLATFKKHDIENWTRRSGNLHVFVAGTVSKRRTRKSAS